MLTTILRFIDRTKLLHWVFWAIFLLLESTSIALHHGKGDPFAVNLLFTFVMQSFFAAAVYTILLVLKPRLLYRRKFLLFLLLFFATILVANLLNFQAQQAVLSWYKGEPVRLRFLTIFLSNVFETFLIAVVFLALALLRDYFVQRIRYEQLEKEKVKAELDFLHHQINPHFLFNAINSVFVLIEEDKDTARKSLHTFSEMLRYQLYDCRSEKVELSREWLFIRNYLSIEALRKGDTTQITVDLPLEAPGVKIIPLLLITYVENACKFAATNLRGENFIRISMQRSGDEWVFACSNSTAPVSAARSGRSGIGMHNAERRLQLFYPDQHLLEVQQVDGCFTVTLRLHLDA